MIAASWRRELLVDQLDRLVERNRKIAAEGDGAFQRFFGQRLQELFGATALSLLGRADRLLEQTGLGDDGARCRRLSLGFGSHYFDSLLRSRPRSAREFLQLLVVLQHLFQQALERIGAINLGHEVAELVPSLDQVFQRRNLLGDMRPDRNRPLT